MKDMKKYSIVLIIGIMGLIGCTDLDPTIYSNLTSANAYTTKADVEAALVGIYADLSPGPGDAWLYYGGYIVMTTDYATDMGFSTAAGAPTEMSMLTYESNNLYFERNWRYMYQVVSNANMLLGKIDAVDMDEGEKSLIIAQAKFLRALAYRDITDSFGPVPLLTEFRNPTETKDLPLNSVEEIDALCINDLKEAINILPKQWEGTNLSRATRGAAATLLGKIYMRSHDYTNAKTYIDMVLALRDEGVYQLNPDFKKVWSETNKHDKGSIFCVLHEATQNGTELANHFGPTDHPEVPSRWQYYGVSLDFWRKYSDDDPRKQFFYYNYTGLAPRDDKTEYGFFYQLPEKGQTEFADTVKPMRNVATMKYSYDMLEQTYLDGRTVSIFRLSDVILCKAEIENNLSGPQAALPYLNEIRNRAGAPAYGSSDKYPIPSTKETMDQAILDERGFELVFEFQRRPDLIRFGKYEETVNAYLKGMGLEKPVTVTSEHRYFPYPLKDALLNSYMDAENPKRIPK